MKNTIENAEAFVLEAVNAEDGGKPDAIWIDDVYEMLVKYANSVRPEVVVPKRKKVIIYDDDFKQGRRFGFNDYDDELRRLNPTMTFTELNHTAPTGDKSDEG